MILYRRKASRRLAALLTVVFAAMSARGQVADQASIVFTAVSKEGVEITNLRQEDVRVFENDAPQQIIRFERQLDVLTTLVVAIDKSASQHRVLPVTKESAIAFINSYMRPGKDQIAVVSFAGEVMLEQNLTSNIVAVRRAVNSIVPAPVPSFSLPSPDQTLAAATGLWDTVWLASEEVLPSPPGAERRALIILTDGVDTGSQLKMRDAVERAIKAKMVVYPIGIADEELFDAVAKDKLRKLAERTGGRAFFPVKYRDLNESLAQIQRELRAQYVVSYSPTVNRSKELRRKVRIEVTNTALRKQNMLLAYPEIRFAANGVSNAKPGAIQP